MEVIKDKNDYFGDLAGDDPSDVEEGWSDIQISVAPDETNALILMLAKMAGLSPGRYYFEEILSQNRGPSGYTLSRIGEPRQRPVEFPRQYDISEEVMTVEGVAAQLQNFREEMVVGIPVQPEPLNPQTTAA